MLGTPVSLALQEVAEDIWGVKPEVASVVAQTTFKSDYRAALPRVRHPVLITQTRADSIVLARVGQYLQQNLPSAQLTLMPSVGHLPNFTQPEVFNRALLAFLTEVEANFGGQL